MDSTIELWASKSRSCDAVRAADGASRLVGEVRRVDALDPRDRNAMFDLLEVYFAHVTEASFDKDLGEKESVVLLRDADGCVRGFSTLMRMDLRVGDERVTALFSGDTIVDREFWGASTLSRVWSRHAFTVARSIAGARVYWFLICSGYKTYRFLPVFFREFYPTYTRPTPDRERRIMEALAIDKFPNEYDRARGVVRLAEPAPLVAGVADVTEQRLRDPHVAFFAAANPGHAAGDELVCLTELAPANLTVAGRRMVGRELAGG